MQPKYILDLDGTLYRFKNSATLLTSSFYSDIKKNIFSFLASEVGVAENQLEETFSKLKQTYGEQISIAIEKEFGINREQYFSHTWNLDPQKYIDPTDEPRIVLEHLKGNFAILTNAPMIWAKRALQYLNVYDLTKDLLFTGEPDIRKPSPEAFRQVGEFLQVPFEHIYSVGDQLHSDILPPKSLGMKTILIGAKSDEADYCVESLEEMLLHIPLDKTA